MSLHARRAVALAALLLAAGCADRPDLTAPRESPPAAEPLSQNVPDVELQARNERIARRFAMALRNEEFRAQVYASLRASREAEGKVHLQRLLSANMGHMAHELVTQTSGTDADLAADLDPSPPIEIYFPVPAHRLRWKGGTDVLVATAVGDHDAPVAFDLMGRRMLLSADDPPATPVLALGRAETRFTDAGLAFDDCPDCFFDPTGGGSAPPPPPSGGGLPVAPASGGLYMTYAKFDGTFEGWLKGDPEFEVHILGQDGSSSSMKSYQCAGEKAGAPYQYDQNSTEWSGNVMLFSQAQLDAYKAQHPGQAIRVFVVEDDDGTCVIKTDSARVERMFQQIITTYGDLTGGKDTVLVSVKTFKKAFSLFRLLKSVWSVITTADDVVGTAIEDVVAREAYPGANWIVKGENTVTHGGLRLEMR